MTSSRAQVKRIRGAMADAQSYGPNANTISELLDEFIDKVNLVISDNKVSLQEFTMIVLCGIRMAIQFCDILPVDNSRRRIIVMATAGNLFDRYAKLVLPIWVRPFWFLISPSLKQALVTATSGAIEFLLPLIRNSYL